MQISAHEIDGRIVALTEQRNRALNDHALAVGQIALARARIAELEVRLKELETKE